MLLKNEVIGAVAISFLLLMVAYQRVKACSCDTRTEEGYYCDSDDVVKMTILNETVTTPDAESYMYNVSIDTVFKTLMGLTSATEMTLYTPRDRSMCPLYLTTGHQYLLSVYEEGTRLTATACSWVRNWENLNPNVTKLLHGFVQPNCA